MTAENVAENVTANVTEAIETMKTPGFLQRFLDNSGEWILSSGIRLLVVLFLVVVGLKVIRKIRNGLNRSMEKAGVEVTLRKFLDALIYVVMLGVLVFMAAESIGIKATSLVAVFGSLTLAMSLAMQDTLANFAGGVMILFLQPYKVGDYISTPAAEGTVESIGLVYTTLITPENRKIVIPNSTMTGSVVTNITSVEKRKLILLVGISYTADLKKAKEVVYRLLREQNGIIQEDEMLVVVDSLGESSVNLSIRGWTKTEDYWSTRWGLTEKIKLTFDEEGIEIPYNYLNVTIMNEKS